MWFVIHVKPGTEAKAVEMLRAPHGSEELNEADFIELFTDTGERTVRMVGGFVGGARIVVSSGPLVGRDGEIRKFNRRNRWAYLDTSAAVSLQVTRKDAAAAQAT